MLPFTLTFGLSPSLLSHGVCFTPNRCSQPAHTHPQQQPCQTHQHRDGTYAIIIIIIIISSSSNLQQQEAARQLSYASTQQQPCPAQPRP